jgi:predicted TIM-barrel fold metal-dependent hydrolase
MEFRIISGDSHFVEPPNMWADRMDKKFRDRAPHTVKNLDGKEGEFFVCENITPVPVAGFFGSGKSAEELPQHTKKGFEVAPKSVWDPAERLKEQDRDGVVAEAMYTSMGMLLFGLKDADLRASAFTAFNDWAAEYVSYNPKRLIGLGAITLEDIPAGVAELKRIAKNGLRGALIWGAPPEDRPYSNRAYDPFFAAAQELDFPLSLHILTSRRGHGIDFSKILHSYMSLPHEIQITLADMVYGGVFERFPKLKVVSAENDVSWLPHFMYRLDHGYDRLRHFENVQLSKMPSEYIKSNVWATFQFEDTWIDNIRTLDTNKIMWSSDYPHTDSPWPRSKEYIHEHFTGAPGEIVAKVVGGNAATLYNIN